MSHLTPRRGETGGGASAKYCWVESGRGSRCDTVKSRIIEPCVMSLELAPQVRSGVFLFLYVSPRAEQLFFTPIPKWGILDYIAQVQLFEILRYLMWKMINGKVCSS